MTGPAHTTEVTHLSHGWQRWRAACSCSWSVLCQSFREAEQAAQDHAHAGRGRYEAGRWAS